MPTKTDSCRHRNTNKVLDCLVFDLVSPLFYWFDDLFDDWGFFNNTWSWDGITGWSWGNDSWGSDSWGSIGGGSNWGSGDWGSGISSVSMSQSWGG